MTEKTYDEGVAEGLKINVLALPLKDGDALLIKGDISYQQLRRLSDVLKQHTTTKRPVVVCGDHLDLDVLSNLTDEQLLTVGLKRV